MTNASRRRRNTSRGRSVNSTSEVSQASKGRKLSASTRSSMKPTPSTIDEDFEVGENTLAVPAPLITDFQSEADFEIYSNTPLQLPSSSLTVRDPSNNNAVTLSTKAKMSKFHFADGKNKATRASTNDISNIKRPSTRTSKKMLTLEPIQLPKNTEDRPIPDEESLINDTVPMVKQILAIFVQLLG
jgi:hypothetical protein